MIERTFQSIPEGKLSEADQQSFLVSLGWSRGTTWEDLLRSRRVLMISEAGAGKTYECRGQAKRLWDDGEPAFFIEMAALATGDLRSQLDEEEETRLDAWLASQSDVATFFLDSIDELKLTLGSFEQALKCLKKGIGSQLNRARIVITTRPIPFDEQLVRHLLPVPPAPSTGPSEETFAKIAMRDHQTRQVGDEDEDAASDWRTVALMPLSDAQIVEFARDQGVEDPAALLDDLKKRNAQEFARHPLRHRGMPFRTLKRLIFAQTKGKTIVRPSKRPIAGWLALAEDGIFEMLRDNEPAVLLNEGDPEALSQSQRNQALRAYVERYGQGGWRGLSVPHIQVHRFASPELADDIRQLWEKGIENPDVRQTLLYLVEAGRIDGCADIMHDVARDVEAPEVERMIVVDAMVAISDPRLKDIASEVAAADALWPDKIARSVLLRLFPRDLSIEQLCQTLSWMQEGERRVGDLSWHLPHLIADAELDPPGLEVLRDRLVKLLSVGLRWRKEWPHIVCDRPHLSGALVATCVRGLNGSKSDSWLQASVLALRLHNRESSNDEVHKALHERLRNLSADENARLFWAKDSLVQSLHAIADPRERLAEITLHGRIVELRAERDLAWLKEALDDTARSENDRAMLLEAAMRLAPHREQWRDHVSGLKPLVADQPSLLAAIDERLKPLEHDKEEERWKKKEAQWKKQQEQRDAKNRASWIQFWREVAECPESAFSSERSRYTAWNLWQAMSHDGEDSRASGWNRRFIEEQFGKETADRLRHILMNIWREDHPILPSKRPKDERNTYLVRWQLGLAALYAEAEDPSWANKLTEEEAKLAARYAPIELNRLPIWMDSLVDVHPSAVDAILGNELSWELKRDPRTHDHSMLLQNISYAPESVAKFFLPRLREWLDGDGDVADGAGDFSGATKRLRQVIGVMLKHGDEDTFSHVFSVAHERLQDDLPEELAFVWLPTLMRVDPELGVSALEDRLRTVEPGARSEAVKWFSVLFGGPHDAINLKTPAFTPQLLLRLLRLAYQHVRPVDDAEHEGPYSPDTRDHAERARNEIVNALFEAKGEEGWAAKLEMASDPLCVHFKDRILAVAEEQRAQEIDSVAFDEIQAIALDKTGEAPASTNEAMFAIMSDRLLYLNELLLSDVSPRGAWAGITDERVMRREIARELRHVANGLYKVDQEAVTADEKETDIRLRSVSSEHEAVIELKLGDSRSARELRDTIHNQLVNKYLAAENRRSGCLLVTLAKDRKWKHPDNGTLIGPEELESILRQEAKRVEEEMGGMVALSVHLLDLRPRLPIEKTGKKDKGAL